MPRPMSEEYGGGDVNYSYQYSVDDKYSGKIVR